MSHWHADHVGCASETLAESLSRRGAYERRGTHPISIFGDYVQVTGAKRQRAAKEA